MAVLISEWKRNNDLPTARCVVMTLVPDRWPEGVPLGRRNGIDRSVPAKFLVTESLLEHWPPEIREHSSKLWPPTQIMASDKSWEPIKQWNSTSGQIRADYVLALFARAILGIGDLADRNFCVRGGRLYSIDEDREPETISSGGDVDIPGELKTTKMNLIVEWLATNKQTVKDIMSHWTEPPTDGAAGRYERLLAMIG
jgi:hypothetical protein